MKSFQSATCWATDARGASWSFENEGSATAFVSVSHRGVLRGMHFQSGMVKEVHHVYGEFQDIILDLRVGSPTFLKWEITFLSPKHPSVHVPDGWGHGILALEEPSVVAYTLSDRHDVNKEGSIHPLDDDIDLPWYPDVDLIISACDAKAPHLVDYLKNPVFKFKDSA